MASPILDVDSLLQPIPGDDPAGDSLPFAVRQKLDEFRKEINPNDFAEDDPLRPEQQKKADWEAIIQLTSQTLKESSKDLLVTSRLTEALTKQHGFAGLRDGLALFHRLIAEAWDRILPVIEDGDLDVRATALNWLDDPDRGARFPITIRLVPMVTTDSEGFGWQHWKNMQEGKGTLKPEVFDKAVNDTPHAVCHANVEALNDCLKHLQGLGEALGARMDASAPGLMFVRQAVFDCQKLATQILERKGPASLDMEAGTSPDEAAGAPEEAAPGRAAGRAMRTRADVYRQLTEAATLLQQMEPHSPIPYLVQRAVALGALPFPQLFKALIREENIIAELYRELGIQESQPPAEE